MYCPTDNLKKMCDFHMGSTSVPEHVKIPRDADKVSIEHDMGGVYHLLKKNDAFSNFISG